MTHPTAKSPVSLASPDRRSLTEHLQREAVRFAIPGPMLAAFVQGALAAVAYYFPEGKDLT